MWSVIFDVSALIRFTLTVYLLAAIIIFAGMLLGAVRYGEVMSVYTAGHTALIWPLIAWQIICETVFCE